MDVRACADIRAQRLPQRRVRNVTPLAILLLVLAVSQIVIRVWLRLRPQTIPFGWS